MDFESVRVMDKDNRFDISFTLYANIKINHSQYIQNSEKIKQLFASFS